MKSSRRVEALGYVFLMALIVASFIEVKIRQEVKKRKQPFLVPGNRWTDRPTMAMIFDILGYVVINKVRDGRSIRRILSPRTDSRVYELLGLMGLDSKAYTHVHFQI